MQEKSRNRFGNRPIEHRMLAIKPEGEYSIPEVRNIRRRVINALARSAREVEGAVEFVCSDEIRPEYGQEMLKTQVAELYECSELSAIAQARHVRVRFAVRPSNGLLGDSGYREMLEHLHDDESLNELISNIGVAAKQISLLDWGLFCEPGAWSDPLRQLQIFAIEALESDDPERAAAFLRNTGVMPSAMFDARVIAFSAEARKYEDKFGKTPCAMLQQYDQDVKLLTSVALEAARSVGQVLVREVASRSGFDYTLRALKVSELVNIRRAEHTMPDMSKRSHDAELAL